MNAKTAERLIHCHQPGHAAGANESRIQKAVKFAERDSDLSGKLKTQIAFDQRVAEKLEAIELPTALVEKIAALDGDTRSDIWKAPLKNPGVLAALLSLCI